MLTLDELVKFCLKREVFVTFETEAGPLTYWWKGYAMGPVKVVWQGHALPPDPNHQDALDKAQAFTVTKSNATEKETLARDEFAKLLKSA